MLEAALVVLLAALWGLWGLRGRRGRPGGPPGPWGVPVLGYLPWLDRARPHLTLTALARRYGPIFSLRMGGVPAVVLADEALVRTALAREACSGRAPLYLTHGLMQGHGLICAEGPMWREQRRVVSCILRNLGAARSGGPRGERRQRMQDRILVGVRAAAQSLTRDAAAGGGLDPHSHLTEAVGNVVNAVVFGRTWAPDDPTWLWLQRIQDEGTKLIGVAGAINFLPFLRLLPQNGRAIAWLKQGQRDQHALYADLVAEVRAAMAEDSGKDFGRDSGKDCVKDSGKESGKESGRDSGKDSGRDSGKDSGKDCVKDSGKESGKESGRDSGKDSGRDSGKDSGKDCVKDTGKESGKESGRDSGKDSGKESGKDSGKAGEEADNLLSAWLCEAQRKQDSPFYSDRQLHFLLADLFGAALDTTVTSLRWLLLLLAAHPTVQARLHRELDEVLGGREPSLEDQAALPFTTATIMETQRIRSVTPLGIPHGVVEETSIAGYTIPKGTMLIPLQWAIHMDPERFQDPEAFRPERFIAEDGSVTRPDGFIPFQTGKRMCVGDEWARMMLFLFAAGLLQRLELSALDPLEPPDLEGVCGITLTPKEQKLRCVPRNTP